MLGRDGHLGVIEFRTGMFLRYHCIADGIQIFSELQLHAAAVAVAVRVPTKLYFFERKDTDKT